VFQGTVVGFTGVTRAATGNYCLLAPFTADIGVATVFFDQTTTPGSTLLTVSPGNQQTGCALTVRTLRAPAGSVDDNISFMVVVP
jgi:hypothetical protein